MSDWHPFIQPVRPASVTLEALSRVWEGEGLREREVGADGLRAMERPQPLAGIGILEALEVQVVAGVSLPTNEIRVLNPAEVGRAVQMDPPRFIPDEYTFEFDQVIWKFRAEMTWGRVTKDSDPPLMKLPAGVWRNDPWRE